MKTRGCSRSRQAAARARAIREREERIAKALARLPELAEIKRGQGKKAEEARASSTDADATVMKMGDGGFRPAYNAQYATDGESQVVVGAEVVTVGSDQGQLVPMIKQVAERCGKCPEQWLVDGGYNSHEQIEAAAQRTEVYAPVPKPKDENTDAHEPKPGDSEAVAAWRVRMATDEAKAIYKNRAAVAECVNAQARNRGLTRLLVRGKAKVRCVVLLHAAGAQPHANGCFGTAIDRYRDNYAQRGRFGCRDGLNSMKTPISEQKRPPPRRIGIASPASDTSNARYARASLRRLGNSENGLLHRL